MDSTGESDIRLYYDMINSTQEARLRRPLTRVFEVIWQSVLGMPPPDTWNFKFNSLRQLDEMEKAELAERDAGTIASLHQGGIISTTIALQELKQSSIITGRFTNISEQDIEDSKSEPAPWSEEAQQQEQQQALAGGKPGEPGGGGGPPGGGGGQPKLPGAGPPNAIGRRPVRRQQRRLLAAAPAGLLAA